MPIANPKSVPKNARKNHLYILHKMRTKYTRNFYKQKISKCLQSASQYCIIFVARVKRELQRYAVMSEVAALKTGNSDGVCPVNGRKRMNKYRLSFVVKDFLPVTREGLATVLIPPGKNPVLYDD